jgi:hypothetical protein
MIVGISRSAKIESKPDLPFVYNRRSAAIGAGVHAEKPWDLHELGERRTYAVI